MKEPAINCPPVCPDCRACHTGARKPAAWLRTGYNLYGRPAVIHAFRESNPGLFAAGQKQTDNLVLPADSQPDTLPET